MIVAVWWRRRAVLVRLSVITLIWILASVARGWAAPEPMATAAGALGTADTVETASGPLPAGDIFVLAYEPQRQSSVDVMRNLARGFADASVPLIAVEGRALAALIGPEYRAEAVIVAAEEAHAWLYAPDVLRWVASGGTLVVAYRGWHADLWPPLGVVASAVPSASDPGNVPPYVDGLGLTAARPLWLGVRPAIPTGNFGSSGLGIRFSPDWEVLLSYRQPADLPLLAERGFGAGRIVWWNADCLGSKWFRGLFLYSVLRNRPVAAMSIFNACVVEVDDSPPPAFNAKVDPAASDYGFTDWQFYKARWYPDMFALFAEFGIRATHYPCLNYQRQVQPPFAPHIDRQPFFDGIMALCRDQRVELGVHGYNHQSLQLAVPSGSGTGSETLQAQTARAASGTWPSGAAMREALQCMALWWAARDLPPPLTYVPVNNVVDATGKAAVRAAFPSIRAMCRLYLAGDDYEVDAEGEQVGAGDEFGRDPDVPEWFSIPRISSGYWLDEPKVFTMFDGVLAHGIVHHFVHPDDPFDKARGRGASWEAHLSGLRRLLLLAGKLLPRAEKLTPREFLPRLRDYTAAAPHWSRAASGALTLSALGGRRSWYVFGTPGAGIPCIAGATLSVELDPGRAWLLLAASDTVTIAR